MQSNFLVEDRVSFVVDGVNYDVHNCYWLSKFEMTGAKSARLVFSPDKEFGIGKPWLILNFIDVQVFKSSLGTETIFDSVEEMGYKSRDDEIYEWNHQDTPTDPSDHFVISFFRDGYIRFYARESIVTSFSPIETLT